jgi:hypothetical protein
MMIMTTEQIAKLCKEKELDLLDKYFGNLDKEAIIERPETIGEYEKELPLKIEAEFKEYLLGIWKEINPDKECVFEEQKLRELMTEDDREGIEYAYKDAVEQTIWERITQTNHKDVTYYKVLLKEYTQELLTCMRLDFLEEITGEVIKNKTFE